MPALRSSRTAGPIALATAALLLAACGSDTGSSAAPAPSSSTALGSVGADPAGSAAAAAAATFPVTVTHAFGTTTVDAKPERVATVAWANHDAALALGVVPVGMAKQTYGDDDANGIHPWTAEQMTSLGAEELPVLFDETDAIDVEAVAETQPDVILAAFSGITKEEYATLSEIAPTIAYPDAAWGAPWDTALLTNAKALGLESAAASYIEGIDADIATALAEYPQIAGKTAMFTYLDPTDLSSVGYYSAIDARARYLTDLGLTTPASIEKLSAGSDEFFGSVSAEKADTFDDVDIVFGYGDETLLATLQADPLLGTIPAIKNGAVVFIEDGTPLAAAVSPPTALSLRWSLDDYLPLIAAAADKVQ
ncbi:iron-siderophore ABC transporter substrate-binding protein [Nakamurella sp. GG22]